MRRAQAGFAFLLVLLLATLVLIALSVAVPRVLTEGQREKEEEVVFRGNQYRRALGLYFRRYGRFPLKITELLRSNDRSYLRRAYPDPMTRDGQWRLLRVGPGGEFIGSVNRPRLPGVSPDDRSRPRTGGAGMRQGADSPYPIIGVASDNQAESIRVFEDHTHYDEWEFVFDPTPAARGRAGTGGTGTTGGTGGTGKPRGSR